MAYYSQMKFYIQLVILLFSLLSNSILIHLVRTKSPPKLGSYKYLMCYFAVLSIIYAILDFMVQPYIHSHGSSFVMIMDLEGSIFEPFPILARILVVCLCGCFGATIYAIGINFVFRFFALQREGRLRYFTGYYHLIWASIPILVGSISALTCWFLAPNSELSEYLREDLKVEHGIDVDRITYMGFLYYHVDQNGNIQISLREILQIVWNNIMMFIPFLTIIYYGLKSYSKIKLLISQGESEYSKRLQTQLYKALVAQTLIPMIFLFLPVGINFLCPLIGIDVEWASSIFTFLYSFYPAVDPIPTIFLVDDYRNAFLNFFRRVLSKNQVTSVTLFDPRVDSF